MRSGSASLWFEHTQEGRASFLRRISGDATTRFTWRRRVRSALFFPKWSRNVPQYLLKDKTGYRLEHRLRQGFDEKYGQRPSTIAVTVLLKELPDKVPNLAEKDYLGEALRCFQVGAFRAAIVMCWNMAFDHLCRWVFANHLPAFNVQLPKSFPKAEISAVVKHEDFSELKESQVLQICRSAKIVGDNLYKVLKEKLDRRNLSAHPSGIAVSQATAEDCITDLVQNVVLKIV